MKLQKVIKRKNDSFLKEKAKFLIHLCRNNTFKLKFFLDLKEKIKK